MIAAEVSLAFNGVNERKSWNARPHASDGRETVHFIAPANLITLVLDCESKRFAVRFNKVHAAWGDYVHAIARSLHVVLSTLQTAGLPFDAPEDVEGIEITVTVGSNATYVAWPGEDTPEPPTIYREFDGRIHVLPLDPMANAVENVTLPIMAEQARTDLIREATMPEIRDHLSDITGDDGN